MTSQRDIRPEELEIIVIDGGSTDGSVDIIRQFQEHLAYWVSEPDRGQTHALRKGFDAATGDVLGWLCSDDLLEPRTVREVLDFFDAYPESQFCYGDAIFIGASGEWIQARKEIPFNWFIWRYGGNYIPQPSAFWRRDLYLKVGGLNESYDLTMDAEMFARFVQHTRPVHVPALWSRMRCYPEQKTQSQRRKCLSELREIAALHGAHVRNPVTRLAGYTAAKTVRWTWKLINGCYWA